METKTGSDKENVDPNFANSKIHKVTQKKNEWMDKNSSTNDVRRNDESITEEISNESRETRPDNKRKMNKISQGFSGGANRWIEMGETCAKMEFCQKKSNGRNGTRRVNNQRAITWHRKWRPIPFFIFFFFLAQLDPKNGPENAKKKQNKNGRPKNWRAITEKWIQWKDDSRKWVKNESEIQWRSIRWMKIIAKNEENMAATIR